jgi:hypothetical protein
VFALLIMNGPKLTSADHFDAALQLHQTGRSCIAQHFPSVSDGSADLKHFAVDLNRPALPLPPVERAGRCGVFQMKRKML